MSRSIRSTCETPGPVEVVVWDFGNVLVRWDPPAATADLWHRDVFPDLEARSDFHRLNDNLDAGASNEELLAILEERDPEAAEFWRHYEANAPSSIFADIEGTVDLVHELADAGIPQFGLTNWSGRLAPHIAEIVPGSERLQGVVVSSLVGLVKPDPEIYRVLIERHGLTPELTVFIDDRPQNTAAAAELGFHTHTFDTPHGAPALRRHLAELGLPVAAPPHDAEPAPGTELRP